MPPPLPPDLLEQWRAMKPPCNMCKLRPGWWPHDVMSREFEFERRELWCDYCHNAVMEGHGPNDIVGYREL
jgi:hypothetical protein